MWLYNTLFIYLIIFKKKIIRLSLCKVNIISFKMRNMPFMALVFDGVQFLSLRFYKLLQKITNQEKTKSLS